MPKLFWITLLSILCLSLSVSGEDLYRVSLNSQADADNLISTGVEPVLIVKDGYLVLADSRQSALLSAGDFAAGGTCRKRSEQGDPGPGQPSRQEKPRPFSHGL